MNPDLTCKDVAELLPAYLADAIASPQSDEVAAHLESCPECAMQLATERRLDQLVLRSVDEATPSVAGLQARIHAEISGAKAPRSQWWRYAAVAAAIASIVFGLAIWRGVSQYQAHLLCTDAADDHLTEVTHREARQWRATPQDIASLATRELGTPDLPQAIEAQHLSLSRARVCRLRGDRFMHLVYASLGGKEVSVFLALDKRGQSMERNAVPSAVHHEADLNVDVSTFRTGNLVVVVASDVANSVSNQVATELAHTF